MSFSLTILGSSSALPTSKRFPTAHVLNVHERFFLIDCGEGTQIQLRRYHIRFARINHLFISHLHGDHYFGIWGLISTFNLMGRTSDLHVYADKQLEKIVNCMLNNAFRNEMTFKLMFHFLSFDQQEIIFEDEKVEVISFPLKHRIPTCGFIFREKARQRNIKKEMLEFYKIPIKDIPRIKNGENFITNDGQVINNSILTHPPMRQRTYAFCSDTIYDESLIPLFEGIDLLYHEATFAAGEEKRAMDTMHSTAPQAGMIAKKAGVKKLIVGHFSARYHEEQEIVNQAKANFGNTFPANEGEIFTIEDSRL